MTVSHFPQPLSCYSTPPLAHHIQYVIVGGHGAVQAAVQLGQDHVPVVLVLSEVRVSLLSYVLKVTSISFLSRLSLSQPTPWPVRTWSQTCSTNVREVN